MSTLQALIPIFSRYNRPTRRIIERLVQKLSNWSSEHPEVIHEMPLHS